MIGKGLNFIQKFLNKKEGREDVADFHTTIIRVDDNFISSSSIFLDEVLVGNIYSLKEIIVAPTAEISGNVTSRTASITGKVYGDIISIEYVEVKKTAVISGNIRAKAISIESGAIINGSIRIEGDIDERDLLEKVGNRLPSNAHREPAFLTYALPEEASVKESGNKADIRPAELSKRNGVAAPKAKPVKTESEKDTNATVTSSWY
jgi:cytoskeletal protein CcmA (bactofilin family)